MSENTAPRPPRARRVAAVAVPSIAALVVAGGIGAGALRSGAASGLEPKSAEQILSGMQQAQVSPLSGTIVAKADLGLPDIPGMADSPDLASLVDGSHTMRLWYGGPDKVRLAKLGGSGETDLIRNGSDLWIWSSESKTAEHRTLSGGTPKGHTGAHGATAMPTTPAEASTQILDTVGKDSTVTTNAMSRVAGRDAYELVVTPRQSGTLVKNVRLAVDGETMMPLRVQVNSTKLSSPAYEIGFTDLQLGGVEDRMFTFTPPAGTTVTSEPNLATSEGAPAADAGESEAYRSELKITPDASPATEDTKVHGEGWTRVMVTDLGEDPVAALQDAAGDGSDDAAGAGLEQLTGVLQSLPQTSGSWGSGRVLEGTLFSVVITDDGKIAVGAVPSSSLTSALGSAR